MSFIIGVIGEILGRSFYLRLFIALPLEAALIILKCEYLCQPTSQYIKTSRRATQHKSNCDWGDSKQINLTDDESDNWREVTQSLDIITHSHSPIVLNNTDNFRLYSQVKEEEERDNKMSFSVKWRKLPSKIKVELFPVQFLFNRIIFYVIKEISLDSVFSCIEGLNFSYNYRLLLGFSNITTGNSIFTWIK